MRFLFEGTDLEGETSSGVQKTSEGGRRWGVGHEYENLVPAARFCFTPVPQNLVNEYSFAVLVCFVRILYAV